MIVFWKVSDGLEGHREHELEIPEEEFEDCDTTLDIENIIDNFVRDEFDKIVGFDWRIKYDRK